MTSSAVVGSSASSTFGSQASAIAIAARWRMPPENSCGYRSAAAAGMPTISSSSPARCAGGRALRDAVEAPSARRSAQPTVFTGFSAFIAPWKTIAMSVHRWARTESSPPARMFSPSSSTSPGDASRSAAAAPSARGWWSSCRSPTRRPARTAPPASRREADPLHGVQLAAVGQVEPDVQVARPRAARLTRRPSSARPAAGAGSGRTDRWPTRSRGLSASSIACPSRKHAMITSATRDPGGTIAHHAPARSPARWKAFSMIVPQRDRARVAQPEERERRLVEDRDRDRQHGVRDQQRRRPAAARAAR